MALIKITETGAVPGITKKELPRIHRLIMLEVGMLWHQKMRPKHFTQEGAVEYHYKKRTEKYTRRKRTMFGHEDPLVFSGASRTLSANATIRPFARKADGEMVAGVRVSMPVKAFNFIPKGGKINMVQEFKRVSPREIKEINRYIAVRFKELVKELKRYKTQTLYKWAA